VLKVLSLALKKPWKCDAQVDKEAEATCPHQCQGGLTPVRVLCAPLSSAPLVSAYARSSQWLPKEGALVAPGRAAGNARVAFLCWS